MKPKRIILVRHGQSMGNVDKSIYGVLPDYQVPLTDAGELQAKLAGEEVKDLIHGETVHAYVSPYTRTRQTFAGIKSVIGDQIIKEVEDPRLREQDFGHMGVPENRDELINERDRYGTFYFRMPDGESGADVFDRMSTFFETMHRDFAKDDFADNCLIVSHGLAIRLFMMRWMHWSVEKFECAKNPWNCQVIVMERGDNGKYDITTDLGWYEKPRHEAIREKEAVQ